jgi:alpha-L-fucosidase 2
MKWKKGELAKVVVKSTLGGNCRIRSYSELKLENDATLNVAQGDNENPFYQTHKAKEPLISKNANLKEMTIPSHYLYDIATKSGQKVVLVKK